VAKKFSDCVAEAIRMGHINADEGKAALDIYNAIRSQGADDGKAKSETAKELELTARHRERLSLITAGKISDGWRELGAWQNRKGEADYPTAHRMQFARRGDEGKFVGLSSDGNIGMSIKEIEDGILSTISRQMELVQHELRRGAITGDLRRTSKTLAKVIPGADKTQARLLDVVRAMRGEKVGDPRAQELADIMMDVAEKLRLRFNEAGGTIGKLDGWGGPQSHNAESILLAGQEKWVQFIIDKLDREKMVHSLTKRKLTDTELVESLKVAWTHIVNNGFVDDEKISGVPVGKGELWSQHADHRFLHFKSADAYMAYAVEYGNRDPYASFTAWVRLMTRDIAAMEKFGPNPTTTIAHIQRKIEAQAHNARSTDKLIADHIEKLNDLYGKLNVTNPELVGYRTRLSEIYTEIKDIRSRYGLLMQRPENDKWRSIEHETRIRELEGERLDILDKMGDFYSSMSNKPATVEDVRIRMEIRDTLEELREPIQFAATNNPVDYARKSLLRTNQIWNTMKGANSVPVSFGLSNVMRTIGGWTSLTMLPGAVLSALADPVFGSTSRMRLGMGFAKSNPGTVLIDTIRNMSQSSRREAVQSGVIWESAFNAFQVEAANSSKMAKMRAITNYTADRVHSLGLLTPYTAAGKAAMQMRMMAQFANAAGTAWNDLEPAIRGTLERGGFDAAGWNKIQNAEMHEPKPGALFLRPNEIYDISPALSERYIAMIARETRYAVIEPTPESSSMVLGNSRPGTFSGEMLRAGAMLKGFPIAVLFQWWGQISNDIRAGDNRSAAATGASLIVTGAMMGIFAMAMKDMYAGRDPRKWLDEETYLDGNMWVAAILQAGGLGIYGDLLFSEVNRTGGNLAETVAGPLVQRVDAIKKLTFDNMVQVAKGKPTNFGRELTRVLRQNTPNVLWTKLIVDRMIWDQFQRLVDPAAPSGFQREMSKRKTDYGQSYWWAPGETSPSRPPDLSRVTATRK